MIERVMDSRPADGEDFATWYYNWLELVRQTEDVRQKALDDDMKCAVVLKTAPKELRDHLVLESHVIGDDFAKMNQIVTTWMVARRIFPSMAAAKPPSSSQAAQKDPNAMDVGAVSYGYGKGKYQHAKGGGYGKSYQYPQYGKGGGYGKGYQYQQYAKGGGYGKGYPQYPKGGGYGKDKQYHKGDGKSKDKQKGAKPAVELFRGYCGYCWQWGHKKSQCPNRPTKMDIGSLATCLLYTSPSPRDVP